jgi:hypothetical protein
MCQFVPFFSNIDALRIEKAPVVGDILRSTQTSLFWGVTKEKTMSDVKKNNAPKEEAAPKPKLVHEAHEHGRKIGRMTLAEVNAAIDQCQKQMGGMWSHYGQSLVGRRQVLMTMRPVVKSFKKAA